MLKSTPWPWICARCIARQSHTRKRFYSIAAAKTAAQERQPKFVIHTAPGAVRDDETLRKVFDSREFWNDFAKYSGQASLPPAGLFQNRYLTSPRGFDAFAEANLRKAKKIVEQTLAASSFEDYRSIARDLDRLSDMLCRVIDLSDFVRSTHPDQEIQAAAARAHRKMFNFMNVLNTTTGLNDQLGVAMANPEITRTWSEEELVVAQALKRDFTKSAIALPQNMRERFVRLSQEISELGYEFVEKMEPEMAAIRIPKNSLKGMDPVLLKKYTGWRPMNFGEVDLPTSGEVAAAALRSVEDESVRKALLELNRTTPKVQIQRLQNLLRKRAELAQLTQYESYSHLVLTDKMAKSPESVNKFLQALSTGNRSKVQKELAVLEMAKAKHLNKENLIFQPWDKDFYMSQIRASMRAISRSPDFLAAYFSLGTVMQGLSRLFTRLYGISFVPRQTMPDETWDKNVRRLDIVSESEGLVAVLYCDLFARDNKSPNPAHFTLRCSREITNNELEEAAVSRDPLFATPEEAVNDGMATSRSSGVLKQLPTIALICNFHHPSMTTSKPSLLNFHDVQTLFHEMGHAIHSVLGRTSLQEVSGTRCATDFAELPSILMEHFAADPAVLGLFARHYETDKPLPYGMVAEKLAIDKRFEGSDTETQILLAMADQAYHSTLPFDDSFNSTKVYHQIQHDHGVLPPDPPTTSWQGFFGHLSGYGSTYYSYLFDQVLADRIWKVLFKSGASGASIDRANGEKMKESVLRWGGGRDPWKCVADVLGDSRLEAGDESAMAIVGSWKKGE